MPAHRPTLVPALALAALLGLPALAPAQEAPRAIDQTGTGGGPASTATAPNKTPLGVTKPPGGAGAPAAGPSAEPASERDRREKAEKAKNDRIARSICRGC